MHFFVECLLHEAFPVDQYIKICITPQHQMAPINYSDFLTTIFGVFATIAAIAAVVVALLQFCTTRSSPTRRRIADSEHAVQSEHSSPPEISTFSRPSPNISMPARVHLPYHPLVRLPHARYAAYG